MSKGQYDIVLYGASGFTGKQTVQYFAEHAPGDLHWAIAGRHRERLEAVKAQVGGTAADVDVLVADSRDQAAVDAVVGRTCILLNTAGPFAIYGTALVDACVRRRTHYVDITGETPWVRDLIDRYHEQAAADGTRIIPCCGFDSVPSDLGSYLVVRHLQSEQGVACQAVKAYFQLHGGFNGGTLASAFNLYDSGQAARARDLFLLNPPAQHSREEIERNQDPRLPYYDADIGAWVGPFFMAPVNTRVVRRSQALYERWQAPYGSDFSYQEYLKFDGPLAGFKAAGLTAGIALFQGAVQISPVRHWLKSLFPQPGSGPSEQTLEQGWFRCEFLGLASDGRKIRGYIYHQGDPGNRATVKFVCESALSLALYPDQLPGGRPRGGVLTPATGLGEVLAGRLRRAGVTIELSR